jgi:hypothetical protein
MIELTPEEVQAKAEQIIKDTEGGIVMIGLPLHANPEDQSQRVDHPCSNCKELVQATVLKLKILELTKDLPDPGVLLCTHCLLKFLESNAYGEIPNS